MDPLDVLGFARALIDIDSTTGREGEAGTWLAAELNASGYTVTEQPLGGGRHNIFATIDPPIVVLSTHYDCVPPFFSARVDGERLYGRGACDAKGILAAQVAASARLLARGERRVGLLFVAGEERGSDGAAAANGIAPRSSMFLINGEPTDSRMASATRGALRVRLHARGRAAHSAAPAEGESAIEKLLNGLIRLRSIALPEDPVLGPTFYNVGLIEGGLAPNVVPPRASAEILFRTVGPPEEILSALSPLVGIVEIDPGLQVPAVRLDTIDGFETAVMPFTTDIPFLDRWGKPMLFGPGSFLVAHTDREHVRLDELTAAVGAYERLAIACVDRALDSGLGTAE